METHPTVIILKADQLYAATLRAHVEAVLPGARITVAPHVAAARALLDRAPVDLLLGSLGEGPEGDALDLLAQSTRAPRRARRVLVVTLRCAYRTLSALRTLAVEGVFDAATEEPGAFRLALKRVLAGQRSWSPSVQGQLRQISAAPTALFRLLTDFEQLVLSVIGAGCDDDEAAELLRLSPATISSVRRDLHRKLGVQHRGALIRVAAQKGYVRFTPDGVERPGFALFAAAYRPRQPRRRTDEPVAA
ncbi:MAG: response regulator transcription factor [Verrucomicrobia bacterium]|nr:response regulator transcription factor [Verrucomicrobiota bacterium]